MASLVVSKDVKVSTNTGSEVVLSPQKLRFEELLKNPTSKSSKGNCPVIGKKSKKPTTLKTPNPKNKTLKRSHLTAFECINLSSKEENPKKKKIKKNPPKPTGLLNPKMKNLKLPDFQIWWKKLRQERRIICGIDMSLTNPGLCLINPLMKTIHLFCFRNRKKETSGIHYITHTSSPFKDWTLEISILEERDENQPSLFLFSLFRFARYEERLQKLLSLIGDNTKQDKLVGIEGYSYNSKATQADTFLKELGGCLRLSLCRMKHNIMEIPPSTIKKIFSAQGQSTKNDMYKAYQEKFYLPDLFALMNIGKSEEFKDVPHPIEDIIDSLAVALSVLYLV